MFMFRETADQHRRAAGHKYPDHDFTALALLAMTADAAPSRSSAATARSAESAVADSNT